MMKGVYLYVMLAASVIITNLVDGQEPPSTRRNIFKLPDNSDVSEIVDTTTPWILDEFVPIIEEYKNNLFEDLAASPSIQKIWNFTTDGPTTRDIFFNLINQFLTDIDHPAPAPLANIVSKSGSLFEPMTMQIMFETDGIHLPMFLLAHNIEIDRSTPKRYVDAFAVEIEKADLSDPVSVWQAFLNGYAVFVESFDFKLEDIIDELLEDLASQFFIIYGNMNGIP